MDNSKKRIWLLFPVYGVIVFCILYIIATYYYPGGSQNNLNGKGFSWLHNYWCNLLMENAINSKPNPAKPIALAASFILSSTLILFWFIFSHVAGFKKWQSIIIRAAALLCVITAIFLFTKQHDVVLVLACVFALVPLTATFIGLRRMKWYKLLLLGIFNAVLVGLNNVLYYGNGLLKYLPIVQKVTFVFFLLWICLISIKLYRQKR